MNIIKVTETPIIGYLHIYRISGDINTTYKFTYDSTDNNIAKYGAEQSYVIEDIIYSFNTWYIYDYKIDDDGWSKNETTILDSSGNVILWNRY